MRTVLMVSAILAGWASGALAAKQAPAVLQPSSNWNLDYSEDSCRLARMFGEGEDRVLLSLERYEPGDEFNLTIAGRPMRIIDGQERIKLQFGPIFQAYDLHFNQGWVGELKPAAIMSRAYLNELGRLDDRRDRAADLPAPGPDGQRTTAQEEAGVTWVEAAPSRGSRSIRLATGSMGKPMEAMRGCTDELMSHWGIDVEAHRSLSRRAEPAGNPGTWIRSSDFPASALAGGERGLVFFRLDVDPLGKVAGCHIQHIAGKDEFKEAVCQAITKRGEFKPALDAAGKPIRSYWVSSARFDYPS